MNNLLQKKAISGNLNWDGIEQVDKSTITIDNILLSDINSTDSKMADELKQEIESILNYPKDIGKIEIGESNVNDSIETLLDAIDGKW